MIYMEKIEMQINNDISPNKYLIILIFSFLMTIFFLCWTVTYYIQVKDYIKVNATIIDIWFEEECDMDRNCNRENYIKVKYNFDNETYIKNIKVFFKFNKKINNNNNTTIRINPTQPNEIKNQYYSRLSLIILIFCTVFTLVIWKAYNIRKKGLN